MKSKCLTWSSGLILDQGNTDKAYMVQKSCVLPYKMKPQK